MIDQKLFAWLFLFTALMTSEDLAFAKCVPVSSKGTAVTTNQDPLAQFFNSVQDCPKDVLELRAGLQNAGGTLKSTLVNNRGFHNPKGSYSLFEMVTGRLSSNAVAEGEFLFGHFTAPGDDHELLLNQSPEQGNLMVELLAWDTKKGFYNFYELIGDGARGQWFYRGDSKDIVSDVKLLHRQPNPTRPQFGRTLRCAGCHIAGGPILKEWETPHNDWWTVDRKLPFGDWKPAPSLASILKGLVDADELRKAVNSGISKLNKSPSFQQVQKGLNLQEQLRPLFCPVEMNLESDSVAFDSTASEISVPAASLVDPRLAQGKVTAKRADYVSALKTLRAQFPESTRLDGDHAWLSPVKAKADLFAVQTVVEQGLIDTAFVSSVLAVDFTNPAVSEKRCRLLKLVPEKAEGNWRELFLSQLKQSSDASAQELLQNFTDAAKDAQFHQKRASAFLKACNQQLGNSGAVEDLVRVLFQRRAEVFANEISKNPMGQILEPGFRVIFPKIAGASTPGKLRVSEECTVQ